MRRLPSSFLGSLLPSLLAPALVFAVGCGGKDDEEADTAGQVGDDDDDGDGSSGGADGMMDTAGSDGTMPTGDDGPADTGSVDGFIAEPDGGGPANQCDLWTQDCPAGEKCMPWANDGGGSWNATRCSPISDAPGQPGDDCTVDGSGVSGLDDCDISAMCWDVDVETNIGTCVAFCAGSPENPLCEDSGTACSTSNDGVLNLCLPLCDPLIQDCAEGNACYPEPVGFICSPDASGDAGMYGDACEFLNVCDPGLFCADAGSVPDCAGAAGCCSEFCDVSQGDDSQCQGQAGGQTCIAFWPEGDAPPGQEDYGLCVIDAG